MAKAKSKEKKTKKTVKQAVPAVVETKKKVKAKVEEAPKAKSKKMVAGRDLSIPEGYIGTKELSEQLGVEPTKLRRVLRSMEEYQDETFTVYKWHPKKDKELLGKIAKAVKASQAGVAVSKPKKAKASKKAKQEEVEEEELEEELSEEDLAELTEEEEDEDESEDEEEDEEEE